MNTTQNTAKYKNSSLGLIPEDWEVKELGKIVNEKRPVSYGIVQTGEMVEGGISCIRVTDIVDGNIDKSNFITTSIKISESYKRTILQKGDLVMALRGKIGQVAMIEDDLVGSNLTRGVALIALKDDYYNEFVKQQISSDKAKQIFEKSLNGSALQELSIGILRKIPILIPKSINEQTAIANCLFTWDKAIAAQTQIIAQKELRKKALMQQLLSGKKRLKGFSEKWHLKSLEEVATFRNGKAHENVIDEEGDYKVVNSKFVSTNGSVFKSSNENLCPLFINEIAMVMSDIPNGKALAKCFYVDESNKYTLNQRICSISANKGTNSKFLYYILNRNVHYLSFDSGVSQTNLKKDEVLECPLLLPNKEEQTAIANILQCADEEIQLLKKKLQQLKDQKKGLMQVLLTGKKRLRY